MKESQFFEQQSLSSRVKASIVSEYFPKYCKIIIHHRRPKSIRFIDLFAGPGIYDDGNVSTPILVGRNCKEDNTLCQLVQFIFNDNTYSEQLKENFINEFPEGSMILIDLFGGTPCNQVMRHIQETEKPLEVVGGMNLPMLVNAVLAREEMSGKDFSLDTVENGKNGIFRVDTEGFLSDDDDEDDE